MTRRPVKGFENTIVADEDISDLHNQIDCPFGVVGDRLWVRETWRVGAWDEGLICVDYKSDNYCRKEWLNVTPDEMFERLQFQSTDDAAKVYGMQETFKWKHGESPCRWRPSIHMPRWASRIDLENVDVRVEELQGMPPLDLTKEGFSANSNEQFDKFIKYWNSLYKPPYDWDSNPCVWVNEFKRLEIPK